MEKRSMCAFTLFLLLMATVYLEAQITLDVIFHFSPTKNWTEARLHCQTRYIDLVTPSTIKLSRSQLAGMLRKHELNHVWIGLLRYPNNGSDWKWINVKTGGVSDEIVSDNNDWMDGQRSPVRCAKISEEDKMWHSVRCYSKNDFYCLDGSKIHFEANPYTWHSASTHCRNAERRLATIREANAGDLEKSGWIGLYQAPDDTWKWSGYWQPDYRNWAPGEPQRADCGSFDAAHAEWQNVACSDELPFLCLGDNLVVVNENKTWEDALAHCLDIESPPCENACTYNYTLLSLENISNYNYVSDRIHKVTTDEVWTGLRFLGGDWWWAHRQRVTDQGQLPDCPSQWERCGTISKNNASNWAARDCLEKRSFVCYQYMINIDDSNTTSA